jgi:hypothetical protein
MILFILSKIPDSRMQIRQLPEAAAKARLLFF